MKKKKGFTIVELVVVIAVIGILSAILIPTFIDLTRKANDAHDVSLIKNLNTTLAMGEAEEGKRNDTLHDALEDALRGGFKVENLTPRGNRDIVWNSEIDEFELREAAPETRAEAVKYFKIYNSASEIPQTADQKYSIYLNNKNDTSIPTLAVGFDAGKNENITSLSYVNDSGNKQTAILRTGSGNLTINAPTDTVKHYYVAEKVTVSAVDPNNSYHEYGSVNEVELDTGKLVVEQSGFVKSLKEIGTSANTIIIDGTLMEKDESVTSTVTGSGSIATKGGVIKVYNYPQFQGLAYACNLGTTFEGYTLELQNDIDMTGKTWVPFGIYSERQITNYKAGNKTEKRNVVVLDESALFKGNIDGNDHKIINLSNRGYDRDNMHQTVSGSYGHVFGLIAFAGGDITIKDLDISFDFENDAEQNLVTVGIIGMYYTHDDEPFIKWTKDGNGQWSSQRSSRFKNNSNVFEVPEKNVTFENVTTSGNIYADDAVSVFVGQTYLSYDLYTFNSSNEYIYCSAKSYDGNGNPSWYLYSNNFSTENEQHNKSLEDLKAYATNGEFYEGLNVSDTNEIQFVHGSKTLQGVSSSVCGLAPVLVNFKFTGCTNSANIYATKRASIYIAKCSYEELAGDVFNISFKDCTNSGNVTVTDSTATCGLVSGFMKYHFVSNRTSWKNGLTNTGSFYYNRTTQLIESDDCDIYAAYNYDNAYHHVAPNLD